MNAIEKALVDQAAAEFKDIETKIGLPPGFFAALYEEPEDWAFIVKIVVVIEAVLNAVLAEVSPNHDLADFVGPLGLQGRSGKLALAKAVGVFDETEVEAFAAIAVVRNKFVHSLAGLSGTLDSYSRTLSTEQRIDFLRKTFNADAEDVERFRKEPIEEYAQRLRSRIWWCAAALLMSMCTGDLKNESQRLRLKIAELKSR
jgi:hypothetical protein